MKAPASGSVCRPQVDWLRMYWASRYDVEVYEDSPWPPRRFECEAALVGIDEEEGSICELATRARVVIESDSATDLQSRYAHAQFTFPSLTKEGTALLVVFIHRGFPIHALPIT